MSPCLNDAPILDAKPILFKIVNLQHKCRYDSFIKNIPKIPKHRQIANTTLLIAQGHVDQTQSIDTPTLSG